MSEEKKQKRKELIEKGYSLYPYHFQRTITTEDVSKGVLKNEGALAGRLMRMRAMGQAAFFNIQDMKGQCQCYLKKSELSVQDQDFFKYVDIGDIVGVKGSFFKTKKGENTLRVKSFQILCKTTQMLAEKYHGLEDKELRYRWRHLDLIMNEKSRETLLTRSKIILWIREYMKKKKFIEVETPILQPLYGGAMAFPFSTKHRALDAKLYLKISPELYLKRLIAGGMDKVFEIGRNFRNEGMDRLHNPEFTMMEYYETYTDYQDQMNQVEELVCGLVQHIKNTLKISYQKKEIDFSPPWERISFCSAIKKWGGLDVRSMTPKKIISELKKKGHAISPKASYGEALMYAFEEFSQKHLWNPVFITDFPKDISPLTKSHRSQDQFVERFEPYIAGMEVGNAYTELNDPVDQRERLENQTRTGSQEEFHPVDEDFLHAVGVGMPPFSGVGLGIDRLVMLLTDQSSIREVLWFPTIKPK